MIGKNVFQDEGAPIICKFIERCWSLSTLRASSCRLSDVGFDQISKCLESQGKKSNLSVLILQGNIASESGVRKLLKSFQRTNISYLGLNTYISEWADALYVMQKNHKNMILDSRKSFLAAITKKICPEKSKRERLLEYSCIGRIFEYSGLDTFEHFAMPNQQSTIISSGNQAESSFFSSLENCSIC